MSSMIDDFAGLLDGDLAEDPKDVSERYIESYKKFISSKQDTYSGVYRSSIKDCLSLRESPNMPWKHVCITLDVSKLRDISKPRISQFYIPDFVEEINSIGDSNHSGFGYNEYGRNHLKSIFIPNSVYEIANKAFSFYRKLESVALQEDSRLGIIGSEAFAYCEDLVEVDISKCKGISYLGDRLFAGSAIKKLKINGAIREVSQLAFEECNLSTVYIDGYKYTFDDFIKRLSSNEYEAFWV